MAILTRSIRLTSGFRGTSFFGSNPLYRPLIQLRTEYLDTFGQKTYAFVLWNRCFTIFASLHTIGDMSYLYKLCTSLHDERRYSVFCINTLGRTSAWCRSSNSEQEWRCFTIHKPHLLKTAWSSGACCFAAHVMVVIQSPPLQWKWTA